MVPWLWFPVPTEAGPGGRPPAGARQAAVGQHWAPMRLRLALCAAAFAAGLGAPGPAGAQSSVCFGDLGAAGVPSHPGPQLRFGINPAGEAGAFGPRVEPVPDDPPRTLAALARLRPPGSTYVVRLNRFFWSDGEAGIQKFLEL